MGYNFKSVEYLLETIKYIMFSLTHFRLDDGNGHTATVSFTVSVADIADETPVITTPTNAQTISFNENDEMAGTLNHQY